MSVVIIKKIKGMVQVIVSNEESFRNNRLKTYDKCRHIC